MENKTLEEIVHSIQKVHPEILIEYCKDHYNPYLTHVKLSVDKSDMRGYGTCLTEKYALIKAYAEMVERSVFFNSEYKKTTNGFACHRTNEEAREAALRELIERDALIVSWIIKKAPLWLTDNELSKMGFSYIKEINNRLLNSAIASKVILGIIGRTGDYYTVVGALKGMGEQPVIGFAIDTKCDVDLTSALREAFHGCCYYATILENRLKEKIPLFLELEGCEIEETQHHLEFYLNPKNTENWFFESESNFLTLPKFKVEQLDLKFPTKIAIDLSCAVALGNDHQEFYVGYTTPENLNYERLAMFTTEKSQLNFKLHPLP